MIRTDSPVRRNNILRCLFSSQSGNEHPQARAAFNRAVGQLHAEDIGHSLLTAAPSSKSCSTVREVPTGLRQIIKAVVFIGVHPHLNAKVPDFHYFPIPCLIDNIFTAARRKYWPQQSWILSDPPGNPAPLPQDCCEDDAFCTCMSGGVNKPSLSQIHRHVAGGKTADRPALLLQMKFHAVQTPA